MHKGGGIVVDKGPFNIVNFPILRVLKKKRRILERNLHLVISINPCTKSHINNLFVKRKSPKLEIANDF